MTATRRRKLEFIRSFGPYALEQAVTQMLSRKEAPWLTDEQIDDITSQMVSDVRYTQHHNMRERRRAMSRRERTLGDILQAEINRRAVAYLDAGHPVGANLHE
jgi:hypothetical protein